MLVRFLFLVAIYIVGVIGAFFDLTDIDDPLSLLWNTKDTLFHSQKYGQCNVKNPDTSMKAGVCIHPTHCILSGGKPHGFCGALSTCCTYERSCGLRTTKARVSYFSSGPDALINPVCDYTINVDSNICQIRLDFETFQIAPATLDGNVFRCVTDALVISPNTFGIPPLCGNNDRQHVYIHLDQTKIKVATLQMKLTSRSDSNLMEPKWKIKIQQLECPGDKFFDKNKASNKDFQLLAPNGAIQYFTEPTGQLRSFGFDASTRTNNYPSGLNYAIAFKRSPFTCGVKFTTNYINLGLLTTATGVYRDSGCADYLFVPELSFSPPEDTTKHNLVARLCISDTIGSTIFMSKPPGPLYLHFTSSPTFVSDPNTGTFAFNMRYDLMSC